MAIQSKNITELTQTAEARKNRYKNRKKRTEYPKIFFSTKFYLYAPEIREYYDNNYDLAESKCIKLSMALEMLKRCKRNKILWTQNPALHLSHNEIYSTNTGNILFMNQRYYEAYYRKMELDEIEDENVKIYKVNRMNRNSLFYIKDRFYDFKIIRTVLSVFQRSLFSDFTVITNPNHKYLVFAIAHSRVLFAPVKFDDMKDQNKKIHTYFH